MFDHTSAQREHLHAQLTAIVHTAHAERRVLTDEEYARFASLDGESGALAAKVRSSHHADIEAQRVLRSSSRRMTQMPIGASSAEQPDTSSASALDAEASQQEPPA